MSFGKHILEYLTKTLEKCWKFWENFWNILILFCGIVQNIFTKSPENFKKKCRKSKFWINSGKIMGEHQGNCKLLILRKLQRILKMFPSSFNDIMKKFWRKVGNSLYKFLDIVKGNFVTLLSQFLRKLVKNYPKNLKWLEQILE